MISWDDYWKNYSVSKAERWMIMERNKYINQYIDKIEKDKKNVLEVGCGFGSNIRLIKNTRDDVICHALDNSKTSVEKVKEEIHNVYLADCRDTLLPQDNFDFIFSAGLMEHFENEKPFLEEMKRILSPEGIMLTTVPAKVSLWQLYQLMHFGNWQHGYEKAYSQNGLVKLFNDNGFKILDIFGIDPFSLNGFIMKLLNKSFDPLIKRSPIKSGYTELGIIVMK